MLNVPLEEYFLAKVLNLHILKMFHLKETKYRSEKKEEKSLHVQKKRPNGRGVTDNNAFSCTYTLATFSLRHSSQLYEMIISCFPYCFDIMYSLCHSIPKCCVTGQRCKILFSRWLNNNIEKFILLKLFKELEDVGLIWNE